MEEVKATLTAGGKTVPFPGKEAAGLVEDVVRGIKRRVGEGKRMLSCSLTEAEQLVRAGELADQVKAITAEELTQAEARKQGKVKLTVMEDERDKLVNIVKEKSELREVLVVAELVDMVEGQMVRETRGDTGEVLGYRPASAKEIQGGLF